MKPAAFDYRAPATLSEALALLAAHPEAKVLADRVLVMSPRPGRIDLDLRVDLPRPRRWQIHAEPAFLEFTRRIRAEFEKRGVLRER